MAADEAYDLAQDGAMNLALGYHHAKQKAGKFLTDTKEVLSGLWDAAFGDDDEEDEDKK